jgi:predicted ABC-type transport system involved in lysophospholipase L1 biosynthesis ATPase subunit
MLIVVTHSPALAEMCQQQLEMDDGRLVPIGK